MSRIIAITGAGEGLGKALSQEAAARGNVVIGIGRTASSLTETGSRLPQGSYSHEVADVADWSQVTAAIEKAIARHGRIDALFANAAVYPRVGLLDHDPAGWMQTLAINVGGVFNVCRAVLSDMIARTSGRIVVTGSFAGFAPLPDSSAYSVSKGALHTLVKSLAVEVSGDFPDILINEWVPGVLKTAMGIPDGLDPAVAARWGLDIMDMPAGGPSGQVYSGNQLVQPPRSLKRRILDKLLMQVRR